MRSTAPRHGDGAPRVGWPATVGLWLLFLAPIAVIPGLENRWGWPTLLCAGAAAMLAALSVPFGRMPTWFTALIVLVIVVLLVSSLHGSAPLSQIFGRAPRYEGVFEYAALVAAGWAAARLLGPRAPREAYVHTVRAVAVASILLAFFALLESLGLRPLATDLDRPGSLAGNATDQGLLGALFVALLGAVLLGAWQRTGRTPWWALSGVAAGGVSVGLSGSRAALLAIAVVIIGLAVRLVVRSRRRARAIWAGAGAVVLVVGTLLVVPAMRGRVFSNALATQTVGDRFIIWAQSWRLFASSPWLGVGPNGYQDAITPYFGDEWYQRTPVGTVLDSPHNVVVQAAVTGGIVGFVIGVILIVAVAVVGWHHLATAHTVRSDLLAGALLAVGGVGLALLTHVSSPTTLVPLSALVGMLIAVGPDSEGGGRSRTGTVLSAALVGSLAVCTVADAQLLAARRAAAIGDLGRAESAFASAQTLRPWDVDISLTAARAYAAALESGVTDATEPARQWADQALSRLPLSSDANFIAGMIAVDLKDADAAVADLRAAARLSPADPRIHHQLGLVLLVVGDASGAVDELQRALQLAPDSIATRAALDEACAEAPEVDCAG